jgi:UDP-N-acetylglucosamine acyltransferase
MKRNFIHPTSLVDSDVELGEGNYIGPFCYITGKTKIGNNNRFEGYCSIGTPPEHRDYWTESPFPVIIGNNCIIREHTTVNSGTVRNTVLGNNVTMLRGSHVGHDSTVSDKVNLSCNVLLGGHSYLMEGVNMGLASVCHQFSVLGAYSMIGMGGVVTKASEIIPGEIYVGNPVRFLKENKIGLSRNGIHSFKLAEIMTKYFSLVNK